MDITLNPGGDSQIKELFDVKGGYARLLQACQANFRRPADSEPEFGLLRNGVEKIAVLDEEDCAKLRGMIDLDLNFLRNHLYRVSLMSKVFNDAVDRRLTAYFGCHYLPLWCRFYRNDPEGDAGVSFNWHCDGGPTKHLKILLYLNASDESGGNTQYLTRETTDAFKRIGYVFCDINQRLSDLCPLAKQHDIGFDPQQETIGAGEALIFEPANILHKGVWPTLGPRYLLQICLVPSPAPWREICANFPVPSDNHNWPVVDSNWPARRL